MFGKKCKKEAPKTVQSIYEDTIKDLSIVHAREEDEAKAIEIELSNLENALADAREEASMAKQAMDNFCAIFGNPQ